ncbi:MAG: hypothetical protein R3175_06155 [Marinobacter sp.]|uniref:hypothetical protein n=1 Tax=Marinobacter sp. TaxID=50741 RepID=UPI00299E4E8F|nr:hypothetical protein [Marinobacter sp.]MDX1755625.1 hypothetical protein [Marinobacter sp.]
MRRYLLPILIATSSLHSPASLASETPQSFESCSMITSEYLTVLQLMSRGFDEETLMADLPDISGPAQARLHSLYAMARTDGLGETYSRINAEYARCAKGVYQSRGMPAAGTREAHFHACAGENKVRYDITLAAVIGADPSEVRGQLAPQHRPVANALFDLYQAQGLTAVFDELASELKACLNWQP